MAFNLMGIAPENLKALVVDDHFIARALINAALREKGITNIHMANDGTTGRRMIDDAQLAGSPFHMVFLDWEMPTMQGIDVLKHFREQWQFNNTAIIMVTAVQTKQHVMEAIKSGASGYLIKPLSEGALIKKVGEVIVWVNGRPPLKPGPFVP